MRRLALIVATSSLALGAASPASGASSDIVATHAYIQANYALAQAMVARRAPAQQKILTPNRSLAAECPQVGVGSPENEASQPISHEVAVALWSVSYGLDAAPIRQFQQAVARLRWSKAATTRAAARYVRNLRAISSVPLPHLCATCAPGWRRAFRRSRPRSSVRSNGSKRST